MRPLFVTLVYSLCFQNQIISFVYLSRKSSCHTCNLILCTYQCKSRGGGGGSAGKGWELDARDYPSCRAFDRAKRPQGRDINFDFDRQKPSTNSELVTKSVP